ncbi:MAG: glycosyltransferase [Ignavibacteriaceae bacterium]|nr:glycosyltransferase [Ignavibacteriaceae bacterium]
MISLSMIVKNEEKYLKDCLESVKGIVDEIILVDTGSTDSTLKIAEEYGAKIFHFEWIYDFSAARNYSLEHCTGNWILYLDADERLSSKSVNLLKKLTGRNDKTAYYCQVCSIDEINGRPSVMSYVRLFPNYKSLRFEGAVHEQIEYSLKQNKIRIANSNIEILHIGYNLTKEGLALKAKRNLDILLKEYQKNNSSYYAFQLGQTYGILENTQEAVKYFNIAIRDQLLKPEYKSTAYRYLSIDLTDKQEWDKALELIEKSIKNDPKQPLALLVASKLYLKLSRTKEAEFFCLKAYEENSKQLKENTASSQVILLSQKDILYHCLNIAVSLQNSVLFNFFYKEFEKLSLTNADAGISKEMKYFDVLLNNKNIKEDNITELLGCVNDSNLNVYISMLEHYSVPESKVAILRAISGKFLENSTILNKLGLALAGIQNIDEAIKVFEKSLEINPGDPSTVFYLISTYLQKNNFQKISSLINLAKERHSGIPAVIDRLNLIEQKLSIK